MTQPFSELTRDLTLNRDAPISAVRSALAALDVSPPDDYVAFLARSNGAEGPIGTSGYLVLWPIEQLKPLNDAYHVAEFAPSLVLFGSDGGDVAYAFDRRAAGRMVAVPFIGMRDDDAHILGASFAEFVDRIAKGAAS